MSAAGAPAAPARRRPAPLLASRPAWALLGLLAVALLAFGSVHGSTTQGSRIAYLESVIKCPSCEDLTIAQSSSVPATHLRALVATWVNEDRSNAWIEQQVIAHYGSSELLSPPVSGLDALAWIVPVGVVAAAAVGLSWFLGARHRVPPTARAREGDEELVSAALRERDRA